MKLKKRKEPLKTSQKRLDKFSVRPGSRRRGTKKAKPSSKPRNPYVEAKPRGRPRKMPLNWVTGHAYNFRIQLGQMWKELEGPLLAAQTEAEVKAAFENHGQRYAHRYVPGFVADILALIRAPKFPKRREAQINFLADSLGGRPSLTFRTSRDICERERAKQRKKSPHHIIRKEFYVECSCGYEGPAQNNGCRKCGAEIPPSIEELGRGRVF